MNIECSKYLLDVRNRLIITYLYFEYSNFIKRARARSGIVRRAFSFLAFCIVVAYALAASLELYNSNAGYIEKYWNKYFIALMAADVVILFAVSWKVMDRSLRLLERPWLQVLPLSALGRIYNSIGISAALVLGMSMLLGCFGAMIACGAGRSGAVIVGSLLACAGLLSGGVAILAKTVLDNQRAVLPRSELATMSRPLPGAAVVGVPAKRTAVAQLLTKLDQSRPTWLGIWAYDLTVVGRFPFEVAALIIIALGTSITAIIRHQPLLALGVGCAIAHTTFVATLRCHPLASPVLRASGLNFFPAWLGLIRLPLATSGAVMSVFFLVALAANPFAIGQVLLCVPLLVLANVWYAVVLSNMPTTPLPACILYIFLVGFSVVMFFEYTYLVPILLAAYLIGIQVRTVRRYRGQVSA